MPFNMHMRGFTLLEMIISIGVFVLIIGTSFMAMTSIARSLKERQGVELLFDAISQAQTHAQTATDGSAWGVYLDYDNTTHVLTDAMVFAGETFVGRNTVQDRAVTMPEGVEILEAMLSGLGVSTGYDHEIIFDVLRGSTANYGSMIIQAGGVETKLIISPSGYVVRE